MASHLAKKVLNPIREKVSADRMRFEDGEYNLDLAYILPNIIAMGFPGEGLKSVWRNHIDEVSKMLNKYHENHYRIWNLSEISYDYSKFNNQVEEYGFPDHHNPPLDLLFKIISSMYEWLQINSENVVVVHCVGGKGRTGTVIACFIMYSGVVDEPLKALDFFAERRSKKKKGVTQPSQRRYVRYFSDILNHQLRPFARPLLLHRIVINFAPNFASKHAGFKPFLSVMQTTDRKKLIYETAPVGGVYQFYAEGTTVVINIDKHVAGDVLINCYHKGKQLDKKVFRCAFHTAFINDYVEVFNREELDDTKKNIQRFSNDFHVMFAFTEPEGSYETGESPELSEAYFKVFRNMPKRNAPSPTPNAKKQVRYSCVDPASKTVRYSFLHEGPGPLILDAGGGKPITITPPAKPLPPTPGQSKSPVTSKPLPQPQAPLGPNINPPQPQHFRPSPPVRSHTFSSPDTSPNGSLPVPTNHNLAHSGGSIPTGAGAPVRNRVPRVPPNVPPPTAPHVPVGSFNGTAGPPAATVNQRPASVFRLPKQQVASAPSLSKIGAPSANQGSLPSHAQQPPQQTATNIPPLPQKMPVLPPKSSRIIPPPPPDFDPTFGQMQTQMHGYASEGSFAIITGIQHLEEVQTNISSPPHHPSLNSIPTSHDLTDPQDFTTLPPPDYPILPPHSHHYQHPLQQHRHHSNSDRVVSYYAANPSSNPTNNYYQAPASGAYYPPSDIAPAPSWEDPYLQQQGYQHQQYNATDPYQQQGYQQGYQPQHYVDGPTAPSIPALPPKRPPRG